LAYYLVTSRTSLVPAAIIGGAVLVAIGTHRAFFALPSREGCVKRKLPYPLKVECNTPLWSVVRHLPLGCQSRLPSS
jgi:hypothetical protein